MLTLLCKFLTVPFWAHNLQFVQLSAYNVQYFSIQYLFIQHLFLSQFWRIVTLFPWNFVSNFKDNFWKTISLRLFPWNFVSNFILKTIFVFFIYPSSTFNFISSYLFLSQFWRIVTLFPWNFVSNFKDNFWKTIPLRLVPWNFVSNFIMDPPSSNPFQCKKCDKEFTKASLLKRHAEKANECKKKPKKALCYFCRYNLLLVVPP